jgi:drug/metabolite transporter (DMT)-like permease
MSRPAFRNYAALAVSIILNSATLVLLKAVAITEMGGNSALTVGALLEVGLNPLFVLAVASFLGGIYFWVIALKRLDLSLAYPSVSVSYALIALVSWQVFGEEIGMLRWLGIVVIMAGVTLMFLPARGQASNSAAVPSAEKSEG